MQHVGKSPPRPDGLDKVGGTARYLDDIDPPGVLYGATLRSPHPHAMIRSLRWEGARAPAGAVHVTARDLPGVNGVLLLDDTWPVLVDRETRHVAEPVALVAASTRLQARAALAAFEVDYESLDPVLTWADAEAGESLHVQHVGEDDVEEVLHAAPYVVEGTYTTGHQEHIYIECQGMLAWFEPDGTLRIQGSMQCPYYVHKALVHAMDLPAERVRVEPTVVGGGFGGKEDYPSLLAIHTALLARASGRPVKMVYDRHEDIVATTKRHPSLVRHRTGVDGEGRLLAMDIEVLLDGGAYRTLSPVVLSRAVLHAGGAYRCPHVRVRGRVLRTHTAPNAAFRGFGAPQVLFAVERQMDRIARAVGLDPLEIRRRNVLGPGDRLPTGQVLDDTTSARECLEKVAAKTRFQERWREAEKARSAAPDGAPRRGLGLSLYLHGAGFTGSGERNMASPVSVRLTEEGRIELLTAITDMGQGAVSVLPQIAAEAAGVGLDDVSLAPADTSRVPDSGPTVASRTTMVVGGTLARAAVQLRDRVLEWWMKREGRSGAPRVEEGMIVGAGPSVVFREAAARCFAQAGDLRLTVRHETPEWQVFDDKAYRGVAYATYAWGADVIEVQVDPDTYEVRPITATVVCEVGKVIHPGLCVGQIEGGTLQAVGWATIEEMKLDRGRYLNDRLATYIIPTIKDAPRMDVELMERPWTGGAFGAKGVGELPMDGGAPAVLQAIENATGIVADTLPATPERLLAWEEEGCRVTARARKDEP